MKFLFPSYGRIIIYRLWRGGRILGGSMDFWENKSGDQSWLRTQKGGSLKTLEGFRGGTTQICLEYEDMGGGGNRESHQKSLGGLLQWSNIQRGDRLNFTLFSSKSFAPSPPPLFSKPAPTCDLRFVPAEQAIPRRSIMTRPLAHYREIL